MRPFIVASLFLTLLGGCAKLWSPQECRSIPHRDGHTYRFCESANSITVERLADTGESGAASPPRLLDDPDALEILRREAFGPKQTSK